MAKRIIVVFGALSTPGFSVVESLAECGDFNVHAVVRRTSQDPECRQLLNLGVQLITADLSSPSAVTQVVQGAWGVFLCLPVPLEERDCVATTVTYGRNVVNACLTANVDHVVYITEPSPLKLLGISARHMDARCQVEQMMRESGLKATYILMAMPFEILFGMLRPTKQEKGYYLLDIPTGPALIDYVSAADIGPIVQKIFINTGPFLHKTVTLTCGKLTVKNLCETMNKVMAPYHFRENKTTYDGFRSLPRPGAVDWGNMFEFVVRIDQQYNKEKSIQLNPNLHTFEQWLMKNRNRLLACLEP